MCWPANIVGLFFVALLIFDIIQKEYSSLPYHGILGVCVTGLLWLLCWLIGPSVTMATLVVPLIFAGIFLFSIWFMNESMKKRGCCMTCDGEKGKEVKIRLVKRDIPNNSASTPTSEPTTTSVINLKDAPVTSGKASGTCIPSLKAASL